MKKFFCCLIYENWGLREWDLGEGSIYVFVVWIFVKQSKVFRNLCFMLRNLIVLYVNWC